MSDVDLDSLLARHEEFWSRAPTERPLLNVSTTTEETSFELRGISLPLADGAVLSTHDAPLAPRMFDPSLILDVQEFPRHPANGDASGPRIVDDLLVARAPLGKIPWVEAILGCPVIPKLDTGSMYSAPFLEGTDRISELPQRGQSEWLELLLEYTRLLVEESQGAYQVVQCLQRGPVDLASAVLGHTEMCYAIADDPAGLRKLIEICTETFIKVAKAQEALIPTLNGGRCTPFSVWAPGTVVRTQCDVTSSISARMYEEVFFPYDVEICQSFDYSVVHLHSGYLHTVEVFLKEEQPSAVQVSLDTGSTPYTVHDLIPVFARVLEEKPLFIQGTMTVSELDELLERLPARGLYISTATLDDE